jgi:transcriptional regulator with PAS, ATPase and Fis domain
LEEAAANPEAALHRLAAALVELTGIAGAAIYAAPSGGSGEWALVAEARAHGARETLDPGASGCAEHRGAVAGAELLLVTRAGDDDHEHAREALCRHVLALAGLVRAGRSTNHRRRAPEAVQAVDPWQELAGESVRRYLGSCSSMCRYCDTVLVLGETGTGKELVARGLHTLWQRKGAFVGINCAAVPADLLDAELFGIESGTATGVTARRGRIEQAAGGTLFLDEVADLPIALHTKLLRVLQEREYYSVGGGTLRRADVHIVAATNRAGEDLRGGHMRADLYFRLSQATVNLPPLRDRLDDLPALCAAFLAQLEQRFARGIPGLSVSALAG